MNENLLCALAQADEAYLTGLSNKGIYKRAVKDAEGADASVTWEGDAAVVSISGETCTLRDPLWDSACSCPSRSMCRHLVAAMLWLRSHSEAPPEEAAEEPAADMPEKSPAPAPEAPPAKENVKHADAIRECAAQQITLLADALRWGLVRMPESMAEHLEATAVRCHAFGMADAEKAMRELGTMLENGRERRAIFRAEAFLESLGKAVQMLTALRDADTVTEDMLGVFRQSYEPYPGDLTILPVGQREAIGGEYTGAYYYFLDKDTGKFLTYANVRPVYYDTVTTKPLMTMLWNTGQPMRALMHSEMVLKNAKISGDRLSASQETNVAMRRKADLNCEAVQRLIVQDFRMLPVLLDKRRPTRETEAMFFIHPVCCAESRFDPHTQQLIVTLEDAFGCRAGIRVKYRAETKKLTEEVEQLVSRMTEHPERSYVWLCSASFEDGQLVLYPIDFYDFIRCPAPERAELPEQYTRRDNACAPQIMALMQEAEHALTVLLQGGLQSAPAAPLAAIAEKAARSGMQGFSVLLGDLHDAAESYRHSTLADPVPALTALTRLLRYLRTGRGKLNALCALEEMTKRTA